jgi:RHS repeat-associated protein
MLDVATDPCGHTTTYSYSSSFAGAYPTTIANALSQSTSANFDFNTGLTISATDLNSRTTGYTYDASTWRPTQINNPDGGQTTVCYTDVLGSSCYQSGVFEFIATQKMNSSQSKITTTVFDGLGRPIQTQLNSDPDGADYTATAYDPLGRVSKQYNPTRCSPPTTNCGESTWGFTTYAYDALGRTTSVTAQDGSITTTVYSGNASTVTDPAGVSRESVTDGLGRLTQLFENPAVFNYETDYTYDALNNLLTVNQKGGSTNSAYWRTRTFAYDSLSRLTSALNPESGTVSYTYDENGNLLQKTSPAPDQTGSTTVALSYCYDALNRITGKAYTAQSCPLSSPVASYSYDQTSYGGLTITNGIGRRTGMADQAGTEAWSYDSMGRPLVDQRTTNSLTKSTTYVYLPYVDGSVNTITYPSGRTLTYITGAAERLLSGQDSSTSVYYVSGAHYNAPGALSSLTNGSAVYSTQLYNSRLQPCWLYATTGTALATNTACTASDPTPGNILDLNYNFNFGSADNGNVIGVSNNRSATRSQSFTYDALNRIAAAETTSTYATSPANCWGEAYFYDNLTTAGGAWGNLTAISPPSSAYTGCVQESGLSVSVSQNNQLSQSSNFCYDSAGNLVLQTACPTGSFTPTYSYDAENHLISTAGVNYVYDGDGRRVEKSVSGSVTKIYWYDPSGQVLDETDGSGSATNSAFNEYVFFNGQRIVRRDSSNDAFYYFTDHLGTSRTIAEIPAGQSSATLCYDADFYPFGGERTPIVNTCSQNYKFTGKERDAESNLDNFGARYNSFQWARFLSPDPGNIGASNDDPQSWNAYAYVRNNPANLADPSGAIYCRPASAGEINGGVSMVCDVTDAQYAYSSPKQQSAYDEAGYQHFDCSCDTEKDKDAYQHPNGISNDYIGDLIVLAAALAIVRSLDSPPERLPQDVKREQEYPDPPEARDSGKIGTNPNQKAALDRDIAQMKRDGYTDIRVNQEQVNAQGVRVGQGRPDLQGTDPNNVRQIIEYDQDPARSAAHVARIKANDPAAVVTPKIIK